MRATFEWAGGLRVEGADQVPRKGPLLVVANHVTDLDPILVQFACRRPLHFMAKRELFAMPGLKTLLPWFRAYPVDTDSPDRAALRHTLRLLEAGQAVLVFPEGRLAPGPGRLPLKPGVARIARRAEAPVIVAAISGARPYMPYGTTRLRRVRPRRPAIVRWGSPRRFEGSNDAEILAWLDAELDRLTTDGEHPV